MKKYLISFFTIWILSGFISLLSGQDTPVEILQNQAMELTPLVESPFATQFLEAAEQLPEIPESRVVYYNKETRDVFSEEEARKMSDTDLQEYQRVELGEQFYYNTLYGTPVATVRALDLAAMAGLTVENSTKVLDFGFGSIGQLRLLASIGSQVTGTEIAPLLKAFYNEKDTDRIANINSDNAPGHINLFYGHLPAEEDIVDSVGERYDLVISKNTLKKGCHPESGEITLRSILELYSDHSERHIWQILQRRKLMGKPLDFPLILDERLY